MKGCWVAAYKEGLLAPAVQLPFTTVFAEGEQISFEMFQPGSVFPFERVCMG
jgi:hypothetical protein